MLRNLLSFWKWIVETPQDSRDVETRLLAPLFNRKKSLMTGHVAGLFVCAVALIRIGGVWPVAFTAASLAALLARLSLFSLMRLGNDHAANADLPRWRRPYQAVGLAWSLISGVLCAFCVARSPGETTSLLAVALALGTTSGIATRNAGTPKFAIGQICLWILPITAAAALRGGWMWALVVMFGFYLMALFSIVRENYQDIRALIRADDGSRQMQAILAEREAELRALFENAGAGISEVDLLGSRVTRANRVICEMLGRTEDELKALPLGSSIHPEEREAQRQRYAAIGESARPYDAEQRFVRPDGTTVWLRSSGSISHFTPEGQPSRLVVVSQDVTAAHAAQEMLRLSLDAGSIGHFSSDLIGDRFRCGPETRDMLGLARGDDVLDGGAWRRQVVVEDAERVNRELRELLKRRASVGNFEYRLNHPVTGLRHIETRTRLEYNHNGRAVSLIGVVIDMTARREAGARIAHLAHHDALTDLPNRSLFRARVDSALERARRGEACAIHFLDLDLFKEVNDGFGHPVGDGLLQAVAGRLRAMLRKTDTGARLGGDEFAVLQTPLNHPDDAAAFARRLIDTITKPYKIDSNRINISTSVGVVLSPRDGTDHDRLLRCADLALYDAKSKGRGVFNLFERRMEDNIQAKRALEQDLRHAVAHSGFELFYQPVIDIATRNLLGFEALLRWRHATRGLIMPDEFISLAESTGLILKIGGFVLRQACLHASTWQGKKRVAVNISALEFTSAALVSTVASALHESGLDARQLEIEITETTMLQNTDATLEILHRLKSLGVRIVMDDFGTGFSSLGYLQRFPFDKVKIDRSFIAPLGKTRESSAIVGAVIDLCAGLDIVTTAEGVETESQFDTLVRIGCMEAQGYYFSEPRPAQDIPELITQLERDTVRARPNLKLV